MKRPDSNAAKDVTLHVGDEVTGQGWPVPFRALRGLAPARRIPDDWRDRLPDPACYYAQRVAKLGQPKGNGYAVGLCPFHDDHSPSFGVKLTDARGHWCCYAGCGKGDMVEFHQRLTGMDFKAAVRDLIGRRL